MRGTGYALDDGLPLRAESCDIVERAKPVPSCVKGKKSARFSVVSSITVTLSKIVER